MFSFLVFGSLCTMLLLGSAKHNPNHGGGKHGHSKDGGDDANASGVCYKVADVPFLTEEAAQDWVDAYCQCGEEFRACAGPADITQLWDYMHDEDTQVVVDGYTYPSWKAHEAQLMQAHAYMKYSSVVGCEMTAYDSHSVTVEETNAVMFEMPMPGSVSTDFTAVTVKMTVVLRFTNAGIFASKTYTSEGSVGHVLLMLIGNAGHSASSAVTALVPDSFINAFFQDTSPAVIVFVGLWFLVIYLSLLFCLVKVTSMCLSRGRGSAKGTADSSGKQQQYRIAADTSLFSSTTEVETAPDNDDRR